MPFFRHPAIQSAAAWWSNCRPERAAEGFLRRWGALVVVAVAILYYAQYYRSGLNPGGEGGTVAVVAMRLMEGQRPLVDTFLGYNLMWFQPVVWLFQMTGPDYVALRIYFFALCTVSGVLAFFVVRRMTGSGWYSVLVALGPVLIPGMLFRNYMGFLAMLNMLTLLEAYVWAHRNAWRRLAWMAASGVAIGLTFLVRIDLGIFFILLALGLVGLLPFGFHDSLRKRFLFVAAALALLAAGLLATHVPVYLDARRRGYDEAFVQQYTNWAGLIRSLLVKKLGFDPFAPPAADRPIYTPSRIQVLGLWLATQGASAPARDLGEEEFRPKPDPEEILSDDTRINERVFALITYLPIPVAGVLVLGGLGGMAVGFLRRHNTIWEPALGLLVATGSALTLFPQYFFFRPDTPHLSEFMVPFAVAIGCAVWLAVRWMRRGGLVAWICGGVVIVLGTTNYALFFANSFPKESAGTIAARTKRTYELVAENGVRVWLKRKERADFAELCRLIKAHTASTDYVVCYPYQPTINFMTNRRTYEFNPYIDNAHNVSNFHKESVEKFLRFRPAAIVIDNRPVNQTEDSRFKNWAAETYAWIRENYRHAGTFRRQELYLRPDLCEGDGG